MKIRRLIGDTLMSLKERSRDFLRNFYSLIVNYHYKSDSLLKHFKNTLYQNLIKCRSDQSQTCLESLLRSESNLNHPIYNRL